MSMASTASHCSPTADALAVGYSQVVGIGFHSAILGFNTNGTLDNTFSGDGIRLDDVVPDFDACRDVAIRKPNGRMRGQWIRGYRHDL
ncbi:MAG: hypothetical protein IPM46_00940 [Flavobacteriales bacterium]|nr:hypothetical protein [Flavobacteriales bacterium]